MLDIESIVPARSLGMKRLSGEAGHLGLPLAGNENDKGTAFAGAMFSLCALSGYDLAFELMSERGFLGSLFLLSSTIMYLSPGLSGLEARSSVLRDYEPTESGNKRISVRAEVRGEGNGDVLAVFEGIYVVKI